MIQLLQLTVTLHGINTHSSVLPSLGVVDLTQVWAALQGDALCSAPFSGSCCCIYSVVTWHCKHQHRKKSKQRKHIKIGHSEGQSSCRAVKSRHQVEGQT